MVLGACCRLHGKTMLVIKLYPAPRNLQQTILLKNVALKYERIDKNLKEELHFSLSVFHIIFVL
jgi:hypothetical protein